ncbi:hypothetical protein PM10SUCC1_02190 [Propionigenium maris DSM 9537]|uniref:Alpha/beta hydrolase fold-3 domain-containing protein n=1 Tax=Propionigenium maris DSM 9537 TaxID=1123000 RepID=A0A9W6GIV9_9FUSO|nr:alpha/beta hydrolase [Propionigenium maris]GLI54704.1 hypothetical protein PM10SUCC1_02190 [Propionigenium maris DSM 9537]
MFKDRVFKKLFILALSIAIPLGVVASEQDPLRVAERKLPLPVHASEAVRDTLRAAPSPGIEAIRNHPIPQIPEEWKAFVAEFDKPGIQQGIELAETLNVKYEREVVNGVDVFTITPSEIAPKYRNNLFVHVHGGAWLYGGEKSALRESVRIAHHLKMPVVSINYRKAPDHPAPAAVNDVVAVWSHLITERPADSMMMGGSSAGGNLTTASAMRIRDLGLPMPSALFIGTPAAVLTNTPDSRMINEGIDMNLGTWEGLIEATAAQYLGDQNLKDPYVSPLYGEFHGFPPSMLVTGTRDLLLSDTVLLHRAIRDAGSTADLHVYEGHSHGSYWIPGEDMDNFFGELDTFAETHLNNYRRFRKRDLASPVKVDEIMIPEKNL